MMYKSVLVVPFAVIACIPVKSPTTSGGGNSGVSSINMQMPDKAKFSDKTDLQNKLTGIALEIASTSTDTTCTKLPLSSKAWPQNGALSLQEQVRQGCSYKFTVMAGKLAATGPAAPLEEIYYQGSAPLDAARIAGKDKVGLAVDVLLTDGGRKAGFTFGDVQIVDATDVDVAVNVGNTAAPGKLTTTDLDALIKQARKDGNSNAINQKFKEKMLAIDGKTKSSSQFAGINAIHLEPMVLSDGFSLEFACSGPSNSLPSPGQKVTVTGKWEMSEFNANRAYFRIGECTAKF